MGNTAGWRSCSEWDGLSPLKPRRASHSPPGEVAPEPRHACQRRAGGLEFHTLQKKVWGTGGHGGQSRHQAEPSEIKGVPAAGGKGATGPGSELLPQYGRE